MVSDADGSKQGEENLPRANQPIDIVIGIESQRVRLGIPTRQALAKLAGIKPEMYSYLLRRGREGGPLPVDCLSKVQRALQKKKEKA